MMKGLDIANSDYKPSHSDLTDAVLALLDVSYKTVPGYYETTPQHGSDSSPVSSSASSISAESFDFCEEFNIDSLSSPSDIGPPTFGLEPCVYDSSAVSDSTDASGFYPGVNPDFFVSPGDINSPVSGTNPYDSGSPKPSNSADASPVTAPRTWDTASDATSEGPRYLNYLATPHNNAVNGPSNASPPYHVVTQCTAYNSCLGGALGNFLYGEEDLTVDMKHQEQGPDSSASQDTSAATIVPAQNNTTDNVNLEQAVNEQSAWAVNSLYEEGIETKTNIFDYDTGAGPSTGSSVAAAMLDIGRAPHSLSRDEGAAIISAAPEEPKGKGKRKAMDAPELPPPSKKLHVEPPAQMMDIFIYSWPTPESSTDPERLNQRATTNLKFIQVSPETASGGEQLLSLLGEESAYGTFVHAKDGELKARSMVSARDSHARSLARKGNQ